MDSSIPPLFKDLWTLEGGLLKEAAYSTGKIRFMVPLDSLLK